MTTASLLRSAISSLRTPLSVVGAVATALVPIGVALPDTIAVPTVSSGGAYRGSLGHAGVFPITGPQSFTLRYSVTADDDVNASVVVGSDGTAYMVSKDGVVRAISTSGVERWKSAIGAATVGQPVLTPDGEMLVVGDQLGRVKAWNTRTGEGAWITPRYGQVLGAVSIGAKDLIWFTSTEQRLVALEPDGSLYRTVTMPADAFGGPAIGPDNAVFVATLDQHLRRFSPDGDQTLAATLPFNPTTPPVVTNDSMVTIGVGTEVIRVDGSSGAIVWRKSLGVRVRSMPAVGSDGTVYVGADDGRVVAISTDGSTLWTVQTGGMVLSSPAIDALGNVYVGSGDGILYAFDKHGGRIATYRAFDAIDSPITIGPDGTVFAGSRDNRLYALRDNARRFASSPSDRVGGDLVRDASTGKVYVLIDGTRRWVPDPVTLSRLGLGSRLPISATGAELARVPAGPDLPALTEGALIRSSTGATYRVIDGQRDWLPDGSVGAVDAPDQVVRTLPFSPANGIAIKGTDEKVYVVEDGFRRWARSAEALQGRGISWFAVHLVTDTARDTIPLGVPLP